jgi:hypothetical protein
MISEKIQVEKLRVQAKDKLLSMANEYLNALNKFSGFVEYIRQLSAVSPHDTDLFHGISENYDLHQTNIKTLISELGSYPYYDEEERIAVLEVGAEIVSKVAFFIVDLPQKLVDTDISKKMNLEELMDGTTDLPS